jgi:hypothetical protein
LTLRAEAQTFITVANADLGQWQTSALGGAWSGHPEQQTFLGKINTRLVPEADIALDSGDFVSPSGAFVVYDPVSRIR